MRTSSATASSSRSTPTRSRSAAIIVVQPGEKVPIDGVVEDGVSTLNTAALTGESLPRDVSAGDEIISGCINMTGVLKVRTTKAFGESTVSKILELMENSSSHKSRSESFISRFAKVYTPAVCYSALALAILPPLALTVSGADADWGTWVYRALTFLVISCPCALVISIPLSFFAGLGGAGKEGVLIKGSNYLEALSQTKTVVFDKTGTLTQGVFEVSAVHHSPMAQEKLLEYAALAECASSHPISKSLQKAAGGALDRSRVTDIQEHSGRGVTAVVDGVTVAAGQRQAHGGAGRRVARVPQRRHHRPYRGERRVRGPHRHLRCGKAPLHATPSPRSRRRASPRPSCSPATFRRSRTMWRVTSGWMRSAAELLPADKVARVEELLKAEPEGAKLAFVGDGINDAPVLSRADIGIAMGAMGSDAAIEAADVVLMDDDPMKIAKAIKISRKCIRIVHENIVFSLGVKLLCLLLVALGFANMWMGIFADVGVMVLAVLNAIRALRVHNL